MTGSMVMLNSDPAATSGVSSRETMKDISSFTQNDLLYMSQFSLPSRVIQSMVKALAS